MRYALEGIRVIDMSQMLAGPGTGMYLADQGAEVIKVEPPRGDSSRATSNDPVLGNNSRGFMVLNRNKRGIVLNIQQPEGMKVLHRLLETADVLIINLRGKAALRAGLDYETVHKTYPRLVYASITAYGTRGPYAEKGGYDRMTQGLSGAMNRKWPDGTPITTGVWISDASIPMLLSYGIMLALWARERTGLGQQVETSLLHAAIAMQSTFLVKVEKAEQPLNDFESATYGIYKCADETYINVGALQADQFVRLCRLLDLDHLAGDPRASDPGRRAEFRNDVYPVIEALFATRSAEEWLGLLDEADVPAAPILERAQVFDEPQVLENGMMVRVEHPKAGSVQMFAPPVRLSAMPADVRTPAPTLGQHTAELLIELGYGDREIEELRTVGAI